MRVAIIDYGSGNLHSAEKAFQRAAVEAGISADIDVTDDPARVRSADRVVLPGVGAYADCRAGLDAVPGMVEALEETVRGAGRPFFGICVGMQLMSERGLEYETTQGLGWIAGDVVPIVPADPSLKIPHMGWNMLTMVADHPVFAEVPTDCHAYFVHSYHLKVKNDAELVAVTDHGGQVTAVVGRDNMIGTQFHPEKSQRLGLALIGNFLRWRP